MIVNKTFLELKIGVKTQNKLFRDQSQIKLIPRWGFEALSMSIYKQKHNLQFLRALIFFFILDIPVAYTKVSGVPATKHAHSFVALIYVCILF